MKNSLPHQFYLRVLYPGSSTRSIMSGLLLFLLLIFFQHNLHAQKPNILLVIADDLGKDPVPNYLQGPKKANMPNLEALMKSGITFDNAWVNPLCAPTRATIITGQYSDVTEVFNAGLDSRLPDDAVTLHRYLDQISSGYASCVIGKWHIGGNNSEPDHPNKMGVPYYAGLLMGASPYNAWPMTINGTTSLSKKYITSAITDMAINWIDQQNKPWLCWVAYTAPHTPFHLPPTKMHTYGSLPKDPRSINSNPLPYYLAMVESLDYELGRLIASLSPEELANTVIIFIGDNGTTNQVIQAPYSNNKAKGTLYEGGLSVPMVISGTNAMRKGEREQALVNSSDLFATIVEMTGNELRAYEDSRSILPILTANNQNVRNCLRADVRFGGNTGRGGFAVRNEQFKLITFDNGTQELYDLLSDPYEQNNLLSVSLSNIQQAAYDELVSSECAQRVRSESTERKSIVDENNMEEIRIFPNPSDNQITVTGLPEGQNYFSILQIDGKLVQQGTISGPKSILDIRNLPAGIYIFESVGSQKRFLKE